MDVSLPITGGAAALVVTGFVGKQIWSGIVKWKAGVDDHLLTCAKKESDEKLLSYRVGQMETTVRSLEDTTKTNHRQIMDRLTEMAGPARFKTDLPHEQKVP